MKIAGLIITLLILIMTTAIVYGFAFGDGWDELALLTTYPWFNVALVDIYTGFALFSGWVIFRERHCWWVMMIIILILVLGNLMTCLYALVVMVRSGGSWRHFWLGARADSTPGESRNTPPIPMVS